MRVRVHLTPGGAAIPAGSCAVIIDVLRATTTLTVAFTHGARRVIPAPSPDQAIAIARGDPGSLLCGEREGRPIPGFDLGNSPAEYRAETVAGRTLVFASTNGSLALIAARSARRRVLAAFVNATAAAESVANEVDVEVICSGKEGRFSLEDTACAGWLCARWSARGAELEGAAARLARSLAPSSADQVRSIVRGAAHGRYLASLGPELDQDLEICGALDSHHRAFEVPTRRRVVRRRVVEGEARGRRRSPPSSRGL